MLLDDLRRDVRFGLRTLRRTPGFVVVALLCLGLGVGANVAIFSVVNAVLLRPLPYASPERVVRVFETQPGRGPEWTGSVAFPNYEDFARDVRGVTGLAAYSAGSKNLSGDAGAERVSVLAATANFFETLRVKPMLGRPFLSGEDAPGRNQVVVLGEGLWRRRFGGDPGVLGRTITLDGEPYEVVGVMASAFTFPARLPNDAYLPLQPTAEERATRGSHWLGVIGRLRDGVTLEQANAELAQVARRLAADYPEHQAGRSARAIPVLDTVVGRVRPMLWVLLGAVGLVLLIACGNVANLLLARAAGRQPEISMRLALGASRARLVLQLLIESAVLALGGAVMGLLFSALGLQLLMQGVRSGLPVAEDVGLDGPVLLFTLGLSMVTALIFGLIPALQSTAGNLQVRMVEGANATRAGQHRLRGALVVGEVALSLVLLVGAGLLMRSFYALLATDSGLRTHGVLTAHLSIPRGKYPEAALSQRLLAPVLERVRALPGVQSAGLISMLPIQQAWTNGDYSVEGQPPPDPTIPPIAEFRVTSPGLFASLGVPVLQGRDFTEQEGRNPAKVVVVNQALADRHFGGGSAIGQRLRFGNVTYGIVGVIGNVRQAGLDQPPLSEIHFPYDDPENASWFSDVTLVIRSASDPSSLRTTLRNAIREVSTEQPIYDVLTMDEVIDRSVANRRLTLVLLATFAALAVSLAAAGLYGVVSYLVAQRTREIGIRMALGSEPAGVIRLLLRQGMRLVGLGLLLGAAGAFAASRWLGSLLSGLRSPDPLIVLGLAALLGVIALFATWVPARRASQVDPLLAIRAE
jgi:putative ABC transport system permease protein